MGKKLEKKKTSLEFEKTPGVAESFTKGDIFTKLSALVMGIGCMKRRQFVIDAIILLFEAVVIVDMITKGAY